MVRSAPLISPKVWREFSQLLDRRFSSDVIHTSEDIIRSTFVVALLKHSDVKLNGVSSEYPITMKSPKGTKTVNVDLFLQNGNRSCALEFKYYKKTPASSKGIRSAGGGSFKDIFRLASIKNSQEHARTKSYFVGVLDKNTLDHLTDDEFLKMWYKSRDWLEVGQKQGKLTIGGQVFESQTPSFIKKAGPIIPCNMENIRRTKLGHDHHMIITRVTVPKHLSLT